MSMCNFRFEIILYSFHIERFNFNALCKSKFLIVIFLQYSYTRSCILIMYLNVKNVKNGTHITAVSGASNIFVLFCINIIFSNICM